MDSIPAHILLAVLATVLIWAYVFVRRCGVVGGCLAAIGAGSCLGHPFFHVSVLTIDRVLLLGIAGLYMAQRNFFGVRPKPINRMDWCMLGFVGALFVNVFTSDWKANGGEAVATMLFFYLIPAGVYWLISRSRPDFESYKWIIGFFAVLGVYLAVTGVFEVKGISAAVFPRYIMSAEFDEFIGRARGPYLNPVGNGMYLTAAFLSSLLWWPFVPKRHRPLILAIAGTAAIGCVLTLTRSVWLGLIASFVALVAMVAPRQHRLRVVFVFALFGALGLGAVGGSLSKFKRDKHVSAEQMAESATLRPILAAFAYEMFLDHPIGGVGLSQYRRHNIQYLTERRFDLPMEKAKTYVQHNVYLSLLTETGLIGTSLFIAMLIVWCVAGWKLWYHTSRPLWERQCGLLLVLVLAAYLPNSMFHEMSLIPMLNTLVFFLAGLVRSQQPATA